MIEGLPKEENLDSGKELMSTEEKLEWLDGMEEYGGQLEQEIERLKEELESIEDENERQITEVLIYDLENEVRGMKEFVETGRNPDEDLYRSE